jgi:hypothetical protein
MRVGLYNPRSRHSEEERLLIRREPGLWRRPREVAVWIHMPPSAGRDLTAQVRNLDKREPARVYWDFPEAEDRAAPSDVATITRLPGLSWKHFICDLKAGEIEHVCLLTSPDPTDTAINAISDDLLSSRP